MDPRSGVFLTLFIVCCLSRLNAAQEQAPFGLDHRIPWTTSRLIGSPDPPLPYVVEPAMSQYPVPG